TSTDAPTRAAASIHHHLRHSARPIAPTTSTRSAGTPGSTSGPADTTPSRIADSVPYAPRLRVIKADYGCRPVNFPGRPSESEILLTIRGLNHGRFPPSRHGFAS